jgi:hypothetical protein
MKTVKDVQAEAASYIKEHYWACIAEVAQWYETGVLANGAVRQLASIIMEDGYSSDINALTVARSMIEMTAVRKAHAAMVERLEAHEADRIREPS